MKKIKLKTVNRKTTVARSKVKKAVKEVAEKDYLIIDRSKWKTASAGIGSTSLLNEQGYMCCLGFRCHQMGVPKKDLLNNVMPSFLITSKGSKWTDIPDLVRRNSFDSVINSNFAHIAVAINDNKKISNEEREKQLIKHFATKNIIVEFTGKYAK